MFDTVTLEQLRQEILKEKIFLGCKMGVVGTLNNKPEFFTVGTMKGISLLPSDKNKGKFFEYDRPRRGIDFFDRFEYLPQADIYIDKVNPKRAMPTFVEIHSDNKIYLDEGTFISDVEKHMKDIQKKSNFSKFLERAKDCGGWGYNSDYIS